MREGNISLSMVSRWPAISWISASTSAACHQGILASLSATVPKPAPGLDQRGERWERLYALRFQPGWRTGHPNCPRRIHLALFRKATSPARYLGCADDV